MVLQARLHDKPTELAAACQPLSKQLQTIHSKMSEIVVSKGGKATFACELPDSSFTGKWLQNGMPLQDDGKRILISQSDAEHTLVLTKTKKNDEGKIVFKTDKGNVEVPFELTVTEPPAIDPVKFESLAQELNDLKTGSPMVLRVPFSGASGITATWSFNGKKIRSYDKQFKIVTTSSETKLTLEDFQPEHCGKYEVLLENAFGNTKVPVEVALSNVSGVNFQTMTVPGETVQKSSTMIIEQQEIPSKPAGNVKFDNMSANHFILSFITTSKGGDVESYVVEKSSGGNNWEQCAVFKPGDKTVQVEGLVVGKRYTFRIKAKNAAGESEALESRAVTVQKPSNPPVLDAEVVEKIKGEKNLKSGKDFRLKIPYTGFPLPIAQWSKDGKKLTTKGRIVSETSDVDTSFTISGLNATDSGEFSLLLKNKEGSAKASFKIVIIDVPSPPVGPIEMTKVSAKEMSFSWKTPTADGGCSIDGYMIERKDTKSPGWTPLTKVDPDTLSYTATGLTQGLKYSYRVKACNSEGESKPLTSQLVLASGPPSPPTAPEPTKVSSTAISIAWKEPTCDGGSPVTAYYVEARQDGGEWFPVPSSAVKGTTASLENLTPESDYEFRVCGKNSTGKGDWGESKKPITAMDAPEPPVIPESVKESLAKPVNFKAGDEIFLKVPASGIPKPTTTWSHNGKELKDERAEAKVVKGVAQFRLVDAKRSDSGTYSVTVKNSEGEANADITVNVTSAPEAPGGPVKILKASSKLINIGWAPPSDDGGLHITQYVVEKTVCGTDDEWSRLGKVFPGEDLRMTTDHVEKGKSYKFRINASNNFGTSPYLISNDILADDKYKPPAACEAPKISELTKSACVLSWPEPDDGGSAVTGYLVEMKRIGRRNWVPQNGGRLVHERTLKVKDLSQGNEYQFRITAENEGGSGPNGKESEIITAMDPIPPPPPPTDFQITDKTDKSVSFSWTSPSDLKSENFKGFAVERCLEGREQWEKCNTTPIRSSKFMVCGLKTGDKYKFRVRSYNDGGYSSSSGVNEFIEVKQLHEKPKISFDSSLGQVIEVVASGTLRLMASVSGKPTPTISWRKDGVDLDKRGVIQTQGGVTSLTIRNLAKSDSGVYTLDAHNPSGTIQKAVRLVVKDSPDPPCNIKLGEIQDDGSLLITWDPPKNDGGNAIKHYCLQKRDAYSRSFQTIKDKITGTNFHVRDLKPGCTYYFRIIAENDLGRGDGHQSNLLTVVQRRAPLRIERVQYGKINLNKAASINLALKPVSVKERSTAKFTCAVMGKPDPEITWYKDGVRLRANNKYSMRNHYGVCTLTISDCRPRDAGIYKCEALNPTGRACSEANLTVIAEKF
ncbi:immunoglobulin-like and fibronectin type III domain-containing protein 1 [Clavelina lepadiformis]|uniref:immunoglobulin-like and fibronectin type III domain-containing protein 1 n=1 Tax=Clavelina lepadiformis TaxID=159417 RepID=UPI00404360E3